MFVKAVRFVFTILGAVAGYQVAILTKPEDRLLTFFPFTYRFVSVALVVVVGALIGYLLGGLVARLSLRFVASVDEFLDKRSGSEMVVGTVGLLVGLGVAALFSLALAKVPYIGDYLMLPLFLLCGYVFAFLAARKHSEILHLVGISPPPQDVAGAAVPRKLLDSSVIIDGRVADVVKTGFLEGDVLIPRFVVHELQRVADSADPEKRVRGRRGLDLVGQLKKVSRRVRVINDDYQDLSDVDAKIVRLALDLRADILTTDYNLNKVADIQGVHVLNVNELANAVKSVVLPGEQIEVKILRAGREQEQGVGYLDDGTMIVVEDARPLVGSKVKAEVTSVLQSPSGKMIFTKLVP